MSEQAFINGNRVEGRLPLRTLFYGEGVFETFRYRDKLPVFFDKHYERMKKGAEILGLPLPEINYTVSLVDKAVSESGYSDSYVKICLLSDGGIRFYELAERGSFLIIVRGYTVPEWSVKACVNSFKRSSESPVLSIKSMNYLENVLARRGANASGFDETLFLNERDEITEGSASNIFWIKDGVLHTPSIDCGILPGVTRGIILNYASELGLQAEEGHYFLRDLIDADFAFFTNSIIGSLPVSHINTHSFPAVNAIYSGIKELLFNKLGWVGID